MGFLSLFLNQDDKSKKYLLMVSIVLSVIIAISAGCSITKSSQPSDESSYSYSAVEKELGIKVQGIRLSAGGYILDFRYEAIDPERANILFSRKIQPYLLHEATGGVLTVPTTAKVGPLRNTTNQPVAGKIYFMLFGNAGKFVKAGEKVTVIFGDYRLEHLTVE